MSLMEKDISNMNAQIRRILSFEVSLSRNLSHVQNVIHDLNGIWFNFYVCLLYSCIVSLILEPYTFVFYHCVTFLLFVCTEENGQHSKRLRIKYFWPLTERSLTPYWQYFNYFLGRGGYFLYKIYVHVFVKKNCTSCSKFSPRLARIHSIPCRSFQDDGTIILPHVYSNIRSVYNPTTGIFTADQSGEYAFYLGVECVGNGMKIIDLLKDGSIVAHAACLPNNDVSFYGSTFVVLHVKKGSKIWITNSRHEHIGLRGKTTLSGFLISN